VNELLIKLWPFGVKGVASIPYAGILLAAAALASYQVSRFTYRFIEVPFIRYGKSLCVGVWGLLPNVDSLRNSSRPR